MLNTVSRKLKKEPEYINPFAEFIRKASASEKKQVYENVMRDEVDDQRKLMERARKKQSRNTD